MKSRPLTFLPIGAARAVFLVAIVCPTVALLIRVIGDGEPPSVGFTFSLRQFALLWKSTWLAAVGTIVCIIVSLPGAYVVGRVRRISFHPLIAASFMMILLTPPMVYAFGWERLLPAALHGSLRCIGVWALWAWPIPALLIGAGWSRAGRPVHDAALLVTSPAAAFVRVVLPVLARHIFLSMVIVFVLFFGDYGVPHACGLNVYATELLSWAAGSSHVIDTAWPALPSVVITVMALVAVFRLWRGCSLDTDTGASGPSPHGSSPVLALLAVVAFAVSWVLPIGSLIVKLGSIAAMTGAFGTYGRDLACSLAVALIGGLAVVAMGVGMQVSRRWRWVGVAWAVMFGALPGALVGVSLVAAYNHRFAWWLYDHWPIMAICHVSRFGWVGFLAGALVLKNAPTDVIAQARVDGAGGPAIWRYIRLPMNWPALLCAAAIVAALSVSDAAASSLVRVPDFSPVAHVIIEKFHRFEDGMLISLSLWLVVVTWPCAGLLILALRRWNRQ